MSDSLKRPIEDIDDLNNDEFDITWGGKKSRYLYTYKLQSPLSQTTADTSESETNSVAGSTQTKSTVKVVSQKDSSTESCSSNCSCKHSKNTDEAEEFEEFEVRSLSSCHNIHFSSSDSSDSSKILINEISQNKIICNDTLPDVDDGYNEDTDYQISTHNKNLPPPACFQKCLQCSKENPNPYFQFCFTCFRYRMEYFGKKPEPKSIKKLKMFINNEKTYKNLDYNMSPKEIESNNDVKNKDNLCNICFLNSRNGIINHGKIGHIITCYSCAKRLWSTSNKCPLCNVKIKCVTKMIVV